MEKLTKRMSESKISLQKGFHIILGETKVAKTLLNDRVEEYNEIYSEKKGEVNNEKKKKSRSSTDDMYVIADDMSISICAG